MIRLKYFRISQGLLVKELAAKAGVRRNFVSQFESGRVVPRPDELQKLAAALNYPNPEKLMDHVAAADLAPDAESLDAVRNEREASDE